MGIKERRARKHAEVKRLILEAADDLLRTHGPHGVSLRAVAQRIEYSPTVIYEYFSTKDELLSTLGASGFRRLNAALTARWRVGKSPLVRLREFFWRYYEFSKTNPAYFELIFLDPAYAPDRWTGEGLDCVREAMVEADRLIAACRLVSGVTSDRSPTTLRHILWAAIHGVAVARITKRLPPDVDPDRLAADTLDGALAGLFQA